MTGYARRSDVDLQARSSSITKLYPKLLSRFFSLCRPSHLQGFAISVSSSGLWFSCSIPCFSPVVLVSMSTGLWFDRMLVWIIAAAASREVTGRGFGKSSVLLGRCMRLCTALVTQVRKGSRALVVQILIFRRMVPWSVGMIEESSVWVAASTDDVPLGSVPAASNPLLFCQSLCLKSMSVAQTLWNVAMGL